MGAHQARALGELRVERFRERRAEPRCDVDEAAHATLAPVQPQRSAEHDAPSDRLQRRLDANDLRQVDVALEGLAGRRLEVEFLKTSSVDHDHPVMVINHLVQAISVLFFVLGFAGLVKRANAASQLQASEGGDADGQRQA